MLKNLKFWQKVVLMPGLATLGFAIVFVTVLVSNSRNARLIERVFQGDVPALEVSRSLLETLASIQRGLQDAASSAFWHGFARARAL
jgi:hypothetical protein